MARQPAGERTDGGEADAIQGVLLPRQTHVLFGHEEAEQAFLAAWTSGRLHHAWLLTGPRGIGKATLAFRIARFVLSDGASGAARGPGRLPDAGEARADRLLAAGVHPNLLHLQRPFNDKTGKFATLLTVDEIRRIGGFVGTTAAIGAYRIVVVDVADDMNAAAANALLKTLEEPPARTLFLVLSHAPGRLLPTIRSRCRRLSLAPLGLENVAAAVRQAGIADDLDPATLEGAARLSKGSVRRALRLAASGAITIAREVEGLFRDGRLADRSVRLAVANRIAAARDTEVFEIAADVLRDTIVAEVTNRARAGAPLAAIAELAALAPELEARRRTREIYNLDRQQFLFDALADAADRLAGLEPHTDRIA